MKTYDCDWVDAFTDRPFGGNPCVVVHGADDISVQNRIALVRETRLSECAYVVASDRADFGARYYLPDGEIPMAGHPTVATVVSLVSRGIVPLTDGRAAFTLEVGAGVLQIEVEQVADGPAVVTMTQLRTEFGKTYDPDRIARLFGLSGEDVLDTPQTVSTGSRFCILALRTLDALRRAGPDHPAFEAFLADPETDCRMVFLTVPQGTTPAGDTSSRLFMRQPGPWEDPFTGSATGCMAAYLWARGHLPGPCFVAEQGHFMDRPGQARVEVLGPPDDISGVKVGGSGVVLMRGSLGL
ncbi:phenazine biosynthesis protein PhzF [Oceanicola sp. 22II-s10i]|uniref:PhzF family phenazine biosynthesis protein n=1 Tax=Oceanicola sp. 22II-s10i TaxID=1317116 RepID=UPI000B5230E5|nr:PhzF family phenazine biosynthesis protein [Oceanicola sp. 22II-s10i]OWU84114.1 phenazine biosynthesis protein PhzF [Oceanicola sp. 22II-s10i]